MATKKQLAEAAQLIKEIYEVPLEIRVAIKLWQTGITYRDVIKLHWNPNVCGILRGLEQSGIEGLPQSHWGAYKIPESRADEFARRC